MKFTPRLGKILVLPRKEVKVSKDVPVVNEQVEVVKETNEVTGQVSEVKEKTAVVVKRKVPANYQIGVVLASVNPGINVGDVVVFKNIHYLNFDLVKKAILVDEYQIVGFWNENETEGVIV
jgi:hypothetical protein